MQQLVFLLAVLACPIGMGLMMWFMMKGMGGQNSQNSQNGQNANANQPMAAPTWQLQAGQEPSLAARNDGDARDEDIAALQAQVADLERQNQRLAEQIDRSGTQVTPGIRNAR